MPRYRGAAGFAYWEELGSAKLLTGEVQHWTPVRVLAPSAPSLKDPKSAYLSVHRI